MNRRVKGMAGTAVFCAVFLAAGALPLRAQSDTCAQMKKDISEMKADLKEYEEGGRLDAQDISELKLEAADIKKDLNEYVADPQSEAGEISKAKEGLQLVFRMEEGLAEGRKGKILTSYAKLIELYEWFYDDEDCE